MPIEDELLPAGWPSVFVVTLGSSWDGPNGLESATQITLRQVPGEQVWTESGTLTSNDSTNRLIMYPSSVITDPVYTSFQSWRAVVSGANDGWGRVGAAYYSFGYGAYGFKDMWSGSSFGNFSQGETNGFLGSPTGYSHYYNPNIFSAMASDVASPLILAYRSPTVISCDNEDGPQTIEVAIENGGTGTLEGIVVPAVEGFWESTDEGFRAIEPSSATDRAAGSRQVIELTLNPENLTNGWQTVPVTITSTNGTNSPYVMGVPVALNTRAGFSSGTNLDEVAGDAGNTFWDTLWADAGNVGYTTSLWVRARHANSKVGIERWRNGPGTVTHGIAITTTGIGWGVTGRSSGIGTSNNRVVTSLLADQRWHHLAFWLKNGTGVRIAIDGVEQTVADPVATFYEGDMQNLFSLNFQGTFGNVLETTMEVAEVVIGLDSVYDFDDAMDDGFNLRGDIAAWEATLPESGVYQRSDATGATERSPGPMSVEFVPESPGGGATAPDAPTGLTATTASSTAIDLAWTAPVDDGGEEIIGYQIQRRSPAGSGDWTTIVADTESTGTTYQDTGLTPETQYEYRVAAINIEGVGDYSAADDATTDAAPSASSSGGNWYYLT
jgi:hypothetical protein